MAVVAAQLEAIVSASGVDSTAAQLAAMAASADAADVSLGSVSAAAAGTGAGLDTAGGSAGAAGAGFDALAASADAAAASLSGTDGALAEASGAADGAAAGLTAADSALAGAAASADTATASLQGTAAAETEAGDAGGGLWEKIGGPLGMAAIAVAAVGVASLKMAGDFQEGITQLATGAGEAQSNLAMVSQGILTMAVSTGTSTKDLSDGMYMIESAGQHGAQALQTLEIAAEAAKVGNASLADVANGVTTAMTDYASSNLTAAQAANTLIATVAAGKTHMQDLAQALSTILPVASSVGVSFNNVMASMATMTGEGVPAADAATYLRQMLMALENPAAKGAAALKSIGLTSGQVASEMKKSLPDALQMITEHLAKKFPVGSQAYIAALSAISGGTKQMQGMLDLTGTHLKTFQNNVKTIAGSVKEGGKSVTGWSEVQKYFNFRLAQAKEVVETLLIKIGTALIPVLEQVANRVVAAAQSFIAWIQKTGLLKFAIDAFRTALGVYLAVAGKVISVVMSIISWMGKHQEVVTALKVVLAALAVVVGGVLLAGLALVVIALASVGVAIAVVAAPIIGIIELIQHWGQIMAFFANLWHTIWSAVSAFFVGIWQGILGFFAGVAARFGQALQFMQNIARVVWQGILNAILAPIHLIGAAFEWLYAHNTYFQKLVDAIRGILTAGIKWIRGIWADVIGWIVSRWNYLKEMATLYFMMMYVEIQSKIQQVENFIHSIWEAILSYLQGRWQVVVSLATSLWAKVTGVFQAAWNGISGALHSLWSNIVNFVSGWPSQAVQWGVNLIKSFISGLLSQIGNIGSAIGSIAGKIAAGLGFHSPTKEGEGAKADTWAPALVSMYTAGLLAGIPKFAAAAQKLMKPIAVSLNPTSSLTSPGAPYMPSSAAMLQTSAAQAQAGQAQPIILQVDGRQLARIVMPIIVDQLRYHVGIVGR